MVIQSGFDVFLFIREIESVGIELNNSDITEPVDIVTLDKFCLTRLKYIMRYTGFKKFIFATHV